MELVSYTDLVEDFGHEIVLYEMIGDYQGDYLFLLHSHDAYGFLVQGYGSCSVCDVLEGIEMDTRTNEEYEREIEVLKSEMYQSIVWYPADDMVEYLRNGAEGFFLYENQWEDFRDKAIKRIQERQ